jgi:3-dehydroquinate synthetase
MVLALRFSAVLGHCDAREAERVAAHLGGVGLPTTLAEVGIAGRDLTDWMVRDKKNDGAGLTLILARGIGAAFVARGVDRAALAAFIA